MVIDLAVHDIDIIRHLTGAEMTEVQSLLGHTHASREDSALLQFRMDNGVIAHITTNWVTPYKTRVLQVATKSRFIVADLIMLVITMSLENLLFLALLVIVRTGISYFLEHEIRALESRGEK